MKNIKYTKPIITGLFVFVFLFSLLGLCIPLTVSAASKNISIPKTLTLTVGEKQTLKVNFSKKMNKNKEVNWKSSNEKVAVVSSKGVVTGTGAGTAVITVIQKADKKQTAKCTVTVTKAGITVFEYGNYPGNSCTYSNAAFSQTKDFYIENSSAAKDRGIYSFANGKYQLIYAQKEDSILSELGYYKGYLYFSVTTSSSTGYYRMKEGSSEPMIVIDSNIAYVNIYKDKIYYKDFTDTNGAICSVNLDGSGKKILQSGSIGHVNVANDQIFVYDWSDQLPNNGAHIGVMNLDGSNYMKIRSVVINQNIFCAGLDGYLYFSNANDGGKFYRMKQDGSGIQKLSEVENVCFVNAVDDFAYFNTSTDAYSISLLSLNGKEKKYASGDSLSAHIGKNYIFVSNQANKIFIFDLLSKKEEILPYIIPSASADVTEIQEFNLLGSTMIEAEILCKESGSIDFQFQVFNDLASSTPNLVTTNSFRIEKGKKYRLSIFVTVQDLTSSFSSTVSSRRLVFLPSHGEGTQVGIMGFPVVNIGSLKLQEIQ